MPVLVTPFLAKRLYGSGGTGDRLLVGIMDGSIGAHIHGLSREVWLGHEVIQKIVHKKHATLDQIPVIEWAINHGSVCVDAGGDLVFLYHDIDVHGASFKLVVKAARAADEFWVHTFIKVRAKEAKRIAKKMKQHGIIRWEVEW